MDSVTKVYFLSNCVLSIKKSPFLISVGEKTGKETAELVLGSLADRQTTNGKGKDQDG